MIPQAILSAQRVLVVGGARSGKSTLAERLLANEQAVDYVATSDSSINDPEWRDRVEVHRRRRPSHWSTIESTDLAHLLAHEGPPLLVDCVTVWLSRMMDRHDAWNDQAWPASEPQLLGEVEELANRLADTQRRVVLVTNEVGQGVVPAEASVRRFRDQMGWANQRIAAVCDEVVWAVAGRFMVLEDWR